jgi:hypothetical protein
LFEGTYRQIYPVTLSTLRAKPGAVAVILKAREPVRIMIGVTASHPSHHSSTPANYRILLAFNKDLIRRNLRTCKRLA